MKKIILGIMFILSMGVVNADLNINQTLVTEEDIYHNVDMYAGGNIYTNLNVTWINPNTGGTEKIYVEGGSSSISSLLLMIDIFESNPDHLKASEYKFMSGFMNFMTYLFDYFNEQRINDLEFQVKALKAVQNTIDSDLMCKAEIKVAFDVYNMTQYQCENGIIYHNDNSGGYITVI